MWLARVELGDLGDDRGLPVISRAESDGDGVVDRRPVFFHGRYGFGDRRIGFGQDSDEHEALGRLEYLLGVGDVVRQYVQGNSSPINLLSRLAIITSSR